MAETAFACFNKYRFEVQAENGSRTAKLVLNVANRFDATLVTILVAINALSVALSFLATMLLVKLLPNWDEAWTSLLASLILTLILYLFGETIPKQIARKIPNSCVKLLRLPFSSFWWFFIRSRSFSGA
jgi:putative hemolysin